METAKDVGVQSDLPIFWSRESTLALLSAYETQKVRLGKDFRFKNYMWIAISDALKKDLGKNYSPAQCENRFRVLVRSYRRSMDKNVKSARRKKDFQYQDEMQRIMKGEKNIKTASLLSETGVFAGDGKSDVQIEDICGEPESVTISSKELLIKSGKSDVNSGVVSSEPEPATSSNKQLFIIRGKSDVNSDIICSQPEPATSSSKQLFIISGKTSVNSDGSCRPKETESSLTSSWPKQLFLIGKPTVNNDRTSGEREPAQSSGKQLFIIGKPSVNNDRISGEPEPVQTGGKQLFIISGKSNVNNDRINGESESVQNSGKQLFIISGKPSVNSDKSSSEPEPTPSSNEPEPAASSSKQLFVNPSKPSVSPSEKRKKLKKSFLDQIRADRKLYYEKKLEADKERVNGLERRNDELLEIKKMKLQQTERLIECEQEKLKCEKEKVLILREKLKMYGRLVQVQEESNEILRSINDQLDFLL